ncbi:hypothetical protein QTP88_005343 [Uroleucon formosanum]
MQMIVDEEKEKKTFMTPYPTHFLPPQQLFEYNQNFPSSSAQHLNHNTYPSTQLQKDMSPPSVSNYSSSPLSPQVSHVTSIKMSYDISSPTTTVYSSTPSRQFVHQFGSNNSQNSTNYLSSPPSPFLNENISSYTQNLTHLQRTQNMLIPTLSSLRPQFDQNISDRTSIPTTASSNKFKHPKTIPYKNPGENESAAKYFAHFSNQDNT